MKARKLAGRCHCGVLLELVARDPQDHALCGTGLIPPDPFCPGDCGLRLTFVAWHPDAHLRCFGLRWCGVCHEVAHYVRGGNGRCPNCQKRYSRTYAESGKRKRLPDTPRRRANDRRTKATQRRQGDPVYEREKERKRLKYATDEQWAEARRHAAAAAWKEAHPEPAKDGRATAARLARGTLRGRPRSVELAA